MAELVRAAEGASEICLSLANSARDPATEYALEIVANAIEDALERPIRMLYESGVRWR